MSTTVIFDVYDAELKKGLEAQGFQVFLASEYVARTNKPITDWDFADMQDAVLVALERRSTKVGLFRVELRSQGDRHLEMFAEDEEDGKRTARFQNELLPSGIRALWEAFGSGTAFEMHDGTWCFSEATNGWFELVFFVNGEQVRTWEVKDYATSFLAQVRAAWLDQIDVEYRRTCQREAESQT